MQSSPRTVCLTSWMTINASSAGHMPITSVTERPGFWVIAESCPSALLNGMSAYLFFTGPILVGTQLNWALLGVLTLQIYNFYCNFPNERVGIKALVYWLFFLDLAQTAFTSHFAFGILVTGWGDPDVFAHLPWSSCSIPILTGLVSFSVQLFFAWRIYVLEGDKSRYVLAICVLIVVVGLMQSLSAIVNGIRYAFSSQLSDILQLFIGVKIWLIGSAVCDVVIALTMITILTRYRRMTPWKKSDNVITKLIYNAVETGAITAIAAIVEVILFLLYPQYFFHETPGFILGKMYSNVVLATLNSRSAAPWGGTINTGVLSTRSTSTRQSHQLQLRTPTIMSDEDTGELHASGTAIGANGDIDGKISGM